MAFRLNERSLVQRVFFAIPVADVPLVVRNMPETYLARLMRLVVAQAERSPHLEFCLCWLEAVMKSWGRVLREKRGEYVGEIRSVMRVTGTVERELRRLGEQNGYLIDYLLKQKSRDVDEGESQGDDGDDVLMIDEIGETGDGSEESDGNSSSEGDWIGFDG